jgi:hypothetical protein
LLRIRLERFFNSLLATFQNNKACSPRVRRCFSSRRRFRSNWTLLFARWCSPSNCSFANTNFLYSSSNLGKSDNLMLSGRTPKNVYRCGVKTDLDGDFVGEEDDISACPETCSGPPGCPSCRLSAHSRSRVSPRRRAARTSLTDSWRGFGTKFDAPVPTYLLPSGSLPPKSSATPWAMSPFGFSPYPLLPVVVAFHFALSHDAIPRC